MTRMRRREFLTLLGASAAAWPLAARAQRTALPVIGYLSGQSPAESEAGLAAFRQGLNDTGYVEHRNVGIEYRWAQGQYDRLPTFAAGRRDTTAAEHTVYHVRRRPDRKSVV